MYSKVEANRQRRLWLESLADRGVREYASDVQPIVTREIRQPPARPRPAAAGDDELLGEEGDDLFGGDGADTIDVGAGDDYLFGAGDDEADDIVGGAGNDRCVGGVEDTFSGCESTITR